jgi:hypothetical protein
MINDFILEKWPEIVFRQNDDVWWLWMWHGFEVCWISGDLVRVKDEYYTSKELDPASPEFFDELSIFINSRMKRISITRTGT